MLTYDANNAFNSVRWTDMHEALKQNFKVPDYIRRIVQDYLSNRQLQYAIAEGICYSKVIAGVTQGSVAPKSQAIK